MVEKYYNEKNEVGVLVSHGFGAGWSTWNENELAIDRRIIEKWLNGISSDDMCDYVESLGYSRPYMGGYEDLELEFVPRGTLFCVYEYDGAESIETPETMCMMIA